MSDRVLELRDVHRTHGRGPTAVRALRGVSRTPKARRMASASNALSPWSESRIRTRPPGSMAVTVVRLRISMPVTAAARRRA